MELLGRAESSPVKWIVGFVLRCAVLIARCIEVVVLYERKAAQITTPSPSQNRMVHT